MKRALVAVIALAVLGAVGMLVLLPMLLTGSGPAGSEPTTCAQQTVAIGEVGGLNATQRANAALIVAGARSTPGIGDAGARVALMASMQEDSLNNSTVANDHDSLGLFQMRPSQGWGTPAQVTDPAYEIPKFYAVLTAVDGWQQLDPGAAAQAVERSAFPGAYAPHRATAEALLSSASGSTSTSCATSGGGGNHGPILDLAQTFVGTPYLWGGSAPGGFDCSGLTSYVYLHSAGITIPRTSEAQQAAAQPVTDPQPGDLVFFGSPAHHVGLVADAAAGTMLDAPNTGAYVRVESYRGWSDLAGFGRFQ
jgi:cell wall-associated NlpC family hydrolase